MVVVRDDNTRALRILAGAADLALNAVPPLLVPLFLDNPDYEVRTAPGIGTTYLGINTEAKFLSDRRVRRAIAHAIDRKAIIRSKFGGRARLARSWITPGHWAYAGETPAYDYDPEKARTLLDEAGYRRSGGEPRLHLVLRTGSDRFRQSVARVIAHMLGEVGIAVDLRPTEVAMLIADLNRGHFELTMLQVPEVVEPHVLSWFFASDRVPAGARDEGANRWRFRNPALDAALERGRKTPDRTRRRDAYREAQRILAEELPVVPLWHEDVVAVSNRRARSFAVPRDGRFGTLARARLR
jgi:peptide/nickel transport system substrate-binding protein